VTYGAASCNRPYLILALAVLHAQGGRRLTVVPHAVSHRTIWLASFLSDTSLNAIPCVGRFLTAIWYDGNSIVLTILQIVIYF
jgi:hypothetical protein